MAPIVEKLIQRLSFLMIFIVPLVFFPFTNNVFELPKFVFFKIFVFFLIILWGFRFILERTIIIPVVSKRSFYFFSIAAISLLFFSTLFSISPSGSFHGSYFRLQGLETYLYLAIFFLIFLSNYKEEWQKPLVFTMIMSSLFISLYALLQRFSLDPFPFWQDEAFLGRVFATLGQPNFLGQYLILVIPLSLYAVFRLKQRWIYLIVFFIQITALLFTLSRASFLGLFAAILLFFILFAFFYKKKKLLFGTIAIFLFGISTLYMVSSSNFVHNNALLNRFTFTGENLRSIQTRFQLWPIAWKILLEKPLFGYGLETFHLTFPKYQTADLLIKEQFTATADRAHNLFLDIGVQSGFLGILIVFTCIVWLGLIGIRRLKEKPSLFLITLLSSLFGYFVSLQFGFPAITDLLYAGIFVALIFLTCARQHFSFSLANSFQKMVFTIFIFALVLFSFFGAYRGVKFFQADMIFKNALYYSRIAGDFETSLFYYEKTVEYAKYQPLYTFYMTDAFLQSSKHSSRASKASLLTDALERLEAIKNFSQYDYNYHLSKGQIIAELASFTDAYDSDDVREAFESALALAPTYPQVSRLYGDSLYILELYDEAIFQYESFLDVSPPYWRWKNDLESKSFEDKEKYRIFFKLNPRFREIFVFLARSYFQIEDNEKALYYLEFSDENLDSLTTYGVIYGKIGEIEKARAVYLRALELYPDNVLIQKNLEALVL